MKTSGPVGSLFLSFWGQRLILKLQLYYCSAGLLDFWLSYWFALIGFDWYKFWLAQFSLILVSLGWFSLAFYWSIMLLVDGLQFISFSLFDLGHDSQFWMVCLLSIFCFAFEWFSFSFGQCFVLCYFIVFFFFLTPPYSNCCIGLVVYCAFCSGSIALHFRLKIEGKISFVDADFQRSMASTLATYRAPVRGKNDRRNSGSTLRQN